MLISLLLLFFLGWRRRCFIGAYACRYMCIMRLLPRRVAVVSFRCLVSLIHHIADTCTRKIISHWTFRPFDRRIKRWERERQSFRWGDLRDMRHWLVTCLTCRLRSMWTWGLPQTMALYGYTPFEGHLLTGWWSIIPRDAKAFPSELALASISSTPTH